MVKLWILHLMTNLSKAYDTTPNLNNSKSQPLQMLKSQSILKRFCSNFGFYISGPIITKYIIPHQISNKPPPSNIKISTTSNAFILVKSQPIWIKLWILHHMTNLEKVYDTTLNLNHLKSQIISTTSNA